MAKVQAGLVTAVEVNGPMDIGMPTKYIDTSSPAFWATLFFLVAVAIFFVL